MKRHLASLEYFEADLGIPWFAVALLFVIIVGLTVALLPEAAARTVEQRETDVWKAEITPEAE